MSRWYNDGEFHRHPRGATVPLLCAEIVNPDGREFVIEGEDGVKLADVIVAALNGVPPVTPQA